MFLSKNLPTFTGKQIAQKNLNLPKTNFEKQFLKVVPSQVNRQNNTYTKTKKWCCGWTRTTDLSLSDVGTEVSCGNVLTAELHNTLLVCYMLFIHSNQAVLTVLPTASPAMVADVGASFSLASGVLLLSFLFNHSTYLLFVIITPTRI